LCLLTSAEVKNRSSGVLVGADKIPLDQSEDRTRDVVPTPTVCLGVALS
jgi:hypothetical protein